MSSACRICQTDISFLGQDGFCIDHWDGLPQWCRDVFSERRALLVEVEKLKKFKAYVHERLDKACVPSNPDPEKTTATGCRIGPRLDWFLSIGERIKPDQQCTQ